MHALHENLTNNLRTDAPINKVSHGLYHCQILQLISSQVLPRQNAGFQGHLCKACLDAWSLRGADEACR